MQRVPTPSRIVHVALAVAWVVVAAGLARAQGDGREAPELLRNVLVAARTTPESLTVGDQLQLEVHVDAPPGYQVRFPERVEPNGPVDLVDVKLDPPQTAKQSPGRRSWVAHYTLAVFRVGDLALSPWPVEVRADSLHATARTDSIRVYVTSVLDDSLAAADLRDIKAQAKLPVSPWPWIVAGALLVVAIAVFVWWWRRRRRPRAEIVPLARVRPAHELALEALRRLESQRLPLDGKFKEYYVQLSEILRRYLEDGFTVPALEETTEEILFELDRRGFDRPTLKQVAALCADSDLVKFAKHEPTIEDSVQSLERVREFVVATAARSALSGRDTGAETALAVAGTGGGSSVMATSPTSMTSEADATGGRSA